MTNDEIKNRLQQFIDKYSIKSIILFGSRANGTNQDDSDVDLILEFYNPVSLIVLSEIKIEMEEVLNLDVDIVHGPVTEDDMLEIGEEVVLYAAA